MTFDNYTSNPQKCKENARAFNIKNSIMFLRQYPEKLKIVNDLQVFTLFNFEAVSKT